jgi:hypothetical protein
MHSLLERRHEEDRSLDCRETPAHKSIESEIAIFASSFREREPNHGKR